MSDDLASGGENHRWKPSGQGLGEPPWALFVPVTVGVELDLCSFLNPLFLPPFSCFRDLCCYGVLYRVYSADAKREVIVLNLLSNLETGCRRGETFPIEYEHMQSFACVGV